MGSKVWRENALFQSCFPGTNMIGIILVWSTFNVATTYAQIHNLDIFPRLKTFQCRNNETIPYVTFCNGHQDCRDNSDEKTSSEATRALATWHSCGNPVNDYNGSCLVHRDLVCSGEIKCSNIIPCDLKCDSHYFCQKSKKCVSRTTICNQNRCDGCPEDHEWNNGIGFKCKRNGKECVLPQQLLHDDIPDCDGGADLCFGLKHKLNETSRNNLQTRENLLTEKCFMCLNDATVIPKRHVCNKVIDCPDLTDECLCDGQRPEICHNVIPYESQLNKTEKRDLSTRNENAVKKLRRRSRENTHPINERSSNQSTRCDVGDVRCEGGKCITRESVCDGKRDCIDDEKFDYCRGTSPCRNATRYEKSCRCHPMRGSCASYHGTSCDNVADCPAYPEFEGEVHGENTFPEDECEAFCYSVPTSNFSCSPAMFFGKLNPVWVFVCENPIDLDNNESVMVHTIDGVRACDGKIDCRLEDDEKDCPERFKCETKIKGIVSIKLDQTCDGVKDCVDGSDETRALCNETRFHCPSLGGKKVNIDKDLVCDFQITCDDASDEKNCNDGRFYCENEKPLFVPERRMFDGRGDCSDWSDECPTIINLNSTNRFSSRYELIGYPVLRALVWVMGLLSICGNSIVLYRESRKLISRTTSSSIAIANRLLVINLAASDILMGVYLLAIGIAGLTMRGSYCSFDSDWRSSNACITLGVLTVLSSETSVITMALLTSCRMYAVFQPFKSANQPRKRIVCLLIMCAWAVSLVFALVPLSENLTGTFITHAQLEYSPYSRNTYIILDNARNLFRRMMTYDLKENISIPQNFDISSMSWKELEKNAHEYFVHDQFIITKELGYYSVESVCVPKFFVTKSDRAWGYSFFINLFNFVCFLFVASAYAAITIKTNKISEIRSSRNNDEKGLNAMQQKILRLIITDFCCWIPICIMAFSKLAGADVSDTAYVVAAIVLLPINSALNPLLYSDLPDALFRKIKRLFNKKSTMNSTTRVTTIRSHGTSNMMERTNDSQFASKKSVDEENQM